MFSPFGSITPISPIPAGIRSAIYRNVYLVETNKIHVARDGTFITANLASKEKPFLTVETTISDDHPAMGTVQMTQVDLKVTIYDHEAGCLSPGASG